ncbi:MAG: hypothetical protein P9M14_17825 [Candidatus Alcyoniella australis]|nr:hypothetical protein [Candidatus Alcyoniella australis]
MHLVRQSFLEEMQAQTPDFPSLAQRLKRADNGPEVDSFNTMIDAEAAFHASLTPLQRQKLVDLDQHRPPPMHH